MGVECSSTGRTSPGTRLSSPTCSGPISCPGLPPTPCTAKAVWGYAIAAASVVVALTAPVLGAIADAVGPRCLLRALCRRCGRSDSNLSRNSRGLRPICPSVRREEAEPQDPGEVGPPDARLDGKLRHRPAPVVQRHFVEAPGLVPTPGQSKEQNQNGSQQNDGQGDGSDDDPMPGEVQDAPEEQRDKQDRTWDRASKQAIQTAKATGSEPGNVEQVFAACTTTGAIGSTSCTSICA